MKTIIVFLLLLMPFGLFAQKYCVDTLIFDRMVNEVIRGRQCDSLLVEERKYSLSLKEAMQKADSIVRVQTVIISYREDQIRELKDMNESLYKRCNKVRMKKNLTDKVLVTSVLLNVVLMLILI
jgi:hypothetical protein